MTDRRHPWWPAMRAVSTIDIPRRRSDPLYASTPELREFVPVKRVLVVVITAASLAALAACGSSGPHTQSLPPSPTGVSTAPQSTDTSPSAPTDATKSGHPPTGVSTPSVTPPAQAAVTAYITMLNLYNQASREPTGADTSRLYRYLTGRALSLIKRSLAGMAKHGYAYRGTPADPRLKVRSVLSASAVFLTSCPLQATDHPFQEYDVKTGKALPVSSRTPPPPYLLNITVKKVGTQWKVSDIIQSAGATCHA